MLKQEPGPRLIYLPLADPETLAECLVALANADGGLIVLGVDGQGRPSDPIWEEEAEGALLEAASMCRPPVPTHWQPVETPNDTFVGLQVPRSTDLHSLDDGRVLIRSGRQNRPLSGDEVRQLAASKNTAESHDSSHEQSLPHPTQTLPHVPIEPSQRPRKTDFNQQ